MSPAYARVYGFDESHTKYASKYSLYLYREQGKDPLPRENTDQQGSSHLTGTPILFIPGNAGSYKQVRSIAAQAANIFYEERESIVNPNVTSLDFFAADFNGDFTAFHGRTMTDQSEYLNDAVKFILSLYQNNEKPACSVILLGHSMGGVVARVMLSLPNYLEGSVNTILTLAAPHAAAPATFDGELISVMSSADDFWRKGGKLRNVTVVSITGGILDTTLPADYTTLTGIVPDTNGLTVTTSGIPGVWTPMDHLAIVWCDQLRRIVARTLLEVTDREMIGYSRDHRMEVFRKYFKGVSSPLSGKTFGLKIDLNQLKDSARERSFQLPAPKSKRDSVGPDIHMLQLPQDGSMRFSFLSSLRPTSLDKLAESSSPAILFCRTVPSGSKPQSAVFDYTSSSTSQFVQLDCIDVHDTVQMVPRSGVSSAEKSSYGGESKPFYSLDLSAESLSNINTIVIAEPGLAIPAGDFVLADLQPESATQLTLGQKSLWKLLSRGGYDLTLPSQRPLVVDIDVPSARSSLLAYSFDIRYRKSPLERFSPFLSQTVGDDTKWHIDLNHVISHILGDSPFSPYKRSANMKLRLYTDSFVSDQITDIYMSVDWFKSLRNLVLRYRLSIVGLPMFVTCFVFFLQLQTYISGGCFPDFGDTLYRFCSLKILAPITAVFCVLSSITSIPIVRAVLRWLDPIRSADLSSMKAVSGPDVTLDEYFLGIGESALWFYGPIALLISIALVGALYMVVSCVIQLVVLLAGFLSISFSSLASSRRRTFSVVLLMALVLIYFPYQFAFVCCFFTQTFVVLKAYVSETSPSYRNFNLSLLLLMAWILPINVPIMIVWVHNFSLKWATPFSSHHNLLAVLPIVLLIQLNNSGYTLSRPVSKPAVFITRFLVAYTAFYALIFGTRHMFLMHHLFNILCAWFLLLMLQDWFLPRKLLKDLPSKLH
ncbi:DEKNAAC101718 [Brettanomyces naardenensis]|uniref:GPI inositol-deacylase n=1 Tax=Brettanomyces naardenensis TaxID=13370 RepID=A0A448YIJ7_BRENA|nr:DEKNAAC101718 [Brettanomyces naardenensis]